MEPDEDDQLTQLFGTLWMMKTLFSHHQLSTFQQQYLQSNDDGTSPTWIPFIATLDARGAIPSIGCTSSPTSG
jgi:heme oxygenase